MTSDREALQQEFPDSWRWIRIARRINGWLTDKEANALFELTRDRTPQCNAVVVELGSWQGKSSVLLAAGMRHKQNSRLFCVDPFGSDENPAFQEQHYAALISKMRRSLEEAFQRNIRRCGFSGTVHARKGYSFEVIRSWEEPIDILFIDASHGYAEVHRDVLEWAPFLKIGGTIALHDVSPDWAGPSRVMAEDLQPPYFDEIDQTDSLAWAVKRLAGPLPDLAGRARIVVPKVNFYRRQGEIAQLSTNLKYLTDEVERVSADLAASKTSKEEGKARIEALREENEELSAARQKISGELRAAEAALSFAEQTIAELRHADAALRHSWSWRLTAPLRLLLDGLRRLLRAWP